MELLAACRPAAHSLFRQNATNLPIRWKTSRIADRLQGSGTSRNGSLVADGTSGAADDLLCCEGCKHNGTIIVDPKNLPCCHLGATTDPAPCAGCGGQSTVPVRLCGLHGECLETTELRTRLVDFRQYEGPTRDRQERLTRQRACESCKDRSAVGSGPKHPHAIAVRFNPAGWKSTEENYRSFRADLPESLPLLTIEVVYPGQSPAIDDAIHIEATDRQVLWQKERLINLAESMLPPECDALFWLDADLLWPDANWVDRACELMRNHQVVHLMEHVDYNDGRSRRSTVAHWRDTGQILGFPGGAWGARREWFRQVGGLPDLNPVGGGDSTFCHGVCGLLNRQYDETAGGAMLNWMRQIKPALWHATGPGCLLGVTAEHLPHGTRDNRLYEQRHDWLREFAFDPITHIRVGGNGLLEWTEAAPGGLIARVRQYFTDRQEDA